MSRTSRLLGRWLVASGFLIPACILVVVFIWSSFLEPNRKLTVTVAGGFVFIASLYVSLVLFIFGSGVCAARVVKAREHVTKVDYLFLALGVNGALFLLIAAVAIYNN